MSNMSIFDMYWKTLSSLVSIDAIRVMVAMTLVFITVLLLIGLGAFVLAVVTDICSQAKDNLVAFLRKH